MRGVGKTFFLLLLFFSLSSGSSYSFAPFELFLSFAEDEEYAPFFWGENVEGVVQSHSLCHFPGEEKNKDLLDADLVRLTENAGWIRRVRVFSVWGEWGVDYSPNYYPGLPDYDFSGSVDGEIKVCPVGPLAVGAGTVRFWGVERGKTVCEKERTVGVSSFRVEIAPFCYARFKMGNTVLRRWELSLPPLYFRVMKRSGRLVWVVSVRLVPFFFSVGNSAWGVGVLGGGGEVRVEKKKNIMKRVVGEDPAGLSDDLFLLYTIRR